MYSLVDGIEASQTAWSSHETKTNSGGGRRKLLVVSPDWQCHDALVSYRAGACRPRCPLLGDDPHPRSKHERKSASRRDARASRIPDVQGSCRPRTIRRGAGSRTPPSRRLLGRSSAALTARVDPWAVFRSRRRWRKRHPRFGSCRRHDATDVVVVVPIAGCFFDAAPAEPDHRRSTTEGYGADDPERR